MLSAVAHSSAAAIAAPNVCSMSHPVVHGVDAMTNRSDYRPGGAAMNLSYDQLRDAVDGGAVGIRSRLALEPLGGAGDKVFPPTYGVADNADTKYATEVRTVPGAD